MDIHRLKELSDDERSTILEGENSSVEIKDYTRPMRADELQQARTDLSDSMLEIGKLEDAFAEVKAAHKQQMKPFEKEKKLALTSIKHRTISENGRVYMIPDHEKGLMFEVIADGTVLHARQLKPEEKQLRINTKAV